MFLNPRRRSLVSCKQIEFAWSYSAILSTIWIKCVGHVCQVAENTRDHCYMRWQNSNLFQKFHQAGMMWQQTRWNYEEKIYKNPLFRSVIPLMKTLERSSQTAILWWIPGTYSLLHIPSDGRMAKCKQAQDSVSSVGITEAPFLPSSAWDRSILSWEYVSSYLLLYNKPLRVA